jgi:DnaJ like chaperone protein
MDFFRQGKNALFDLEKTLAQFRQGCPFHTGLMRLFLEIQLRAAYADGYARANVKHILQHIAHTLGLGTLNFQYYDALFGRTSEQFSQQNQQYHHTHRPTTSALDEAYLLLGVPANVNHVTLKKAYRRLMNQYHPDKLISKGLPDSMIKIATEKTQKIKAAYEMICREKGFKK